MAKPKRKVVVTTSSQSQKSKLQPTSSRKKQGKKRVQQPMLFKRENFKWMLIGVGLIAVGMLLMIGGSMPSPDVWDESLIYSHRRITLAPLFILAGLAVEIYAIFK